MWFIYIYIYIYDIFQSRAIYTAGAFSSSKLPVVSVAGVLKILFILCSNFVVLIILSFFSADSSFLCSFLVQKIVNFHRILNSVTTMATSSLIESQGLL